MKDVKEWLNEHTVTDRSKLANEDGKTFKLARVIEYEGGRYCLLYNDLQVFCNMINDHRLLFTVRGD